jgi:hypothetical protein
MLIFLEIHFWSTRTTGWRRWSLHLNGERCAAFHASVEAVGAINAHVSVAARKDDGIVVFRVKLLKAYHAMKRERRRRRHDGYSEFTASIIVPPADVLRRSTLEFLRGF